MQGDATEPWTTSRRLAWPETDRHAIARSSPILQNLQIAGRLASTSGLVSSLPACRPVSLDAFSHLFIDYGYAIVFAAIALETAGLPLPGELLLVTVGHLARHNDHLNPGVGILVAMCAAVVGDSVGYWVGRLGGRPLLTRLGIGRQRSFRRRFLVCGRFLIGIRLLVAPLAGCSRMPFSTFLLFDGLGAVLWAGVFVLAGYSFNVPFQAVSDTIQAFRAPLALLIGLAVALGIVARRGVDLTPWLRRWNSLEAQRIER
jgi:membrane protein DedA with SNARE-associated domain